MTSAPLVALALLNDGAGALGVGGTVASLRPHRAVQMVSETVSIQLPSCEVSTRFTFRNHGPATTVTMVFPETGGVGHGGRWGAHRTSFDYFRAWVDGRRVRTRRVVGRKEWTDYGISYDYWWAKRVPFGAGQTRVVTNRYKTGPGWEGTGDPQRYYFDYVLRTGRSWSGRIERARVVCRLSGLALRHFESAEPAGYRREGDRLIWDFTRIEPDEDIRIRWRDPRNARP